MSFDSHRSARSWREDLKADIAKYQEDDWLPRGWMVLERTFWAVAVYRLGQGVYRVRNPLLNRALRILYSPLPTLVQSLTAIEIWPTSDIGPGMRIHHGFGLVISPEAEIGDNVVLRQGVTIGRRRTWEEGAPRIGNDVDFGAYAQVFGKITIGDGARIGAHAVVLVDVPAGATAIGNPAIIRAPRHA
jgi:serine O-acetyltransferase